MIKYLRKTSNQEQGFTLIEIILSMGILAIVSIFVLQMFIKSHSLKEMAFDKDYALTTAQTVMEHYKASGPNPDELQFLGGFSPVLISYSFSENPYQYTAVCFFDQNWLLVSAPPEKGYTLRFIVKPVAGADRAGQLVETEVSVIRLHPYLLQEGDNILLCSLQGSAYFPVTLSERT
jgi:prepilin-type N-terminal cleavage/methylation domain-containing protein